MGTIDLLNQSAGSLINDAAEKSVPADSDMVGLMDSASNNTLKKLSWSSMESNMISKYRNTADGLAGLNTSSKIDPEFLPIVNNLTAAASGSILDAYQGNVLNTRISAVEAAVKETGSSDTVSGILSDLGQRGVNAKNFDSLQKAFDSLSNGQTLIIPPGTYSISKTLLWYGKSDITIAGYGAKIIMTDKTQNVMQLGDGNGIGSTRYNIVGLDIDGGNTKGYAIGVQAGGGTYMQQCRVTNCNIHNCATGIYLGGDYNTIDNNVFSYCSSDGINNDGSSFCLLEGNVFKSCYNAIRLELPYYNRVLGNMIYAHSNFGILTGGSGEVRCLIADNIITGSYASVGSGLTGIYIVAGVTNVEVNNNLVSYCGQHGIKSLGNDNSIRNNRCFYNKTNGIMLDNCSRNMVIGNKCVNNGGNGIDLVNTGSNHFIADNQCYDTQSAKTQQYGLSIVPTQTACFVQGNHFFGNKASDISDATYNHSNIVNVVNVDGRTADKYAKDIYFTDSTKGVLLTDRVTGRKYRLLIKNGVLSVEQVS